MRKGREASAQLLLAAPSLWPGTRGCRCAFLKGPEAVRPWICPEPLQGREEREESRRVRQSIEGATVLVLSSFPAASAPRHSHGMSPPRSLGFRSPGLGTA